MKIMDEVGKQAKNFSLNNSKVCPDSGPEPVFT
jgi:hypothetical protein